MNTILLAYDGSGPARKAYAWAETLASRLNAEISILMVNRPSDYSDNVETEAIIQHGLRHCRKVLRSLEDRTGKTGLRVRFRVAAGQPAEQIILQAERLGAELIVMGQPGSSFWSRLFKNSEMHQVIAHAPCAVVVVR